MFSDTTIDPGLIRAYRETEYRVLGDQPATLRVGTTCADLTALHLAHGVDCSAIVTACNPFSERFEEVAGTRQAPLALDLTQRGLHYVEALGQHPTGNWPGEASFLVLGIALDAARNLGQDHRQNALIWSGPDAMPRLILLK